MQPSSSPLVSVVIPSYGRPDLVEQAIKSVLNQTYENIELLVVDDHSPTPVEESLHEKTLLDDRITVIRLNENSGANVARNTGIRRSTGVYVAFLDDDDRWMTEKVQRQVNAFNEASSEVGVVFTGLEHVDDDGRILGNRIPTVDGKITKDLLEGTPLAPLSTVMIRSDVIDRAGLLDERFPSWQDREWYIRLSERCAFKSISEPLVQKLSSSHEQISDDFESKRDVSYPLFLEKHRETARKYGNMTERRLIAAKSYQLGREAMKNNHYNDARKYFVKSICVYPFKLHPIAYFVVVIGGRKTHNLFRYFGRQLGTA